MNKIEISIDSVSLRQLLEAVGKIIPNKSALPVLENVFIRIKDGKMQAMGCNQDAWMSAKTNLSECKMEGDEACFLMYSKQILALLKELPAQPLRITIDKKDNATVEWNNGKSNFVVSDTKDYPMPAKSKDSDVLHATVGVDKITSAFGYCKQAAKPNELHPIIAGIAMDFKSDKSTFIATDTHHMLRLVYNGYKENEHIDKDFLYMMDLRTITAVESMIAFEISRHRGDEKSELITIDYTTANTHISYGEGEVWSRNIEGKYPNYNSVIPNENGMSSCVFGRTEMIAALRRVLVFGDSTSKHVIVTIGSNNIITLNTEDTDYSTSAAETVACESKNELKIALNGNLMSSIIQTMGGENVRMLFTAADRTVLFRSTDSDVDLLALQMPIGL